MSSMSVTISPVVTLNSFQGPSIGLRRSVRNENRAAAASRLASGFAARWMLNQVQQDEVGRARGVFAS